MMKTPEQESRILDLARKYASKHFNISQVQSTQEGVNFSYFIGDPPQYVLKVAAGSSNLLIRESSALNFWKNHGFPVPEIITLDESGRLFSSPVLVMKYVPHERQEPKPKILGDLLGKLHKIGPSRTNESLFNFLSKTNWTEILSTIIGTEQDAASEITRKALARIDCTQRDTTLLHGDYCHGHILFNKQGLAAIIDPDPIIGDLLWDVAFYLIHNPSHRTEFLEGYAPAGLSRKDEFILRTYESIACLQKVRITSQKLKFTKQRNNTNIVLRLEKKLDKYNKRLEGCLYYLR